MEQKKRGRPRKIAESVAEQIVIQQKTVLPNKKKNRVTRDLAIAIILIMSVAAMTFSAYTAYVIFNAKTEYDYGEGSVQ